MWFELGQQQQRWEGEQWSGSGYILKPFQTECVEGMELVSEREKVVQKLSELWFEQLEQNGGAITETQNKRCGKKLRSLFGNIDIDGVLRYAREAEAIAECSRLELRRGSEAAVINWEAFSVLNPWDGMISPRK